MLTHETCGRLPAARSASSSLMRSVEWYMPLSNSGLPALAVMYFSNHAKPLSSKLSSWGGGWWKECVCVCVCVCVCEEEINRDIYTHNTNPLPYLLIQSPGDVVLLAD